MRKFIVAAACAVALIATPAISADKAGPAIIPEVTPSSVAPSCYVQALSGGSVVAADVGGALPASLSAQSWSVSAGVGCDVKMGRVVVGALARIEVPVDTSGALIDLDKSWMAALRAGYMLNTGLLAYGLVGYEASDFSLAAVDFSRDGLVVGGGLEIMLSSHLSLTTEYTYAGLGKIAGIEPEQHKVRVGISYRLNSIFGE